MSRKFTYLISFILLVGLGFSNIASADSSLVGWWKLDGNANDSSGGGRHGTTYGTPAPTYAAGPTYGDNVQFYTGDTAISFTGLTQARYVSLPIGDLINSLNDDCSFTMWVNYNPPDGGNRNERIFDFGPSAGGTGPTSYMSFMPRRSSSAPPYFTLTDGTEFDRVWWGTGTGYDVTPYTFIPTGRWLHLAVTISDSNGTSRTFRMYADGVQVGLSRTGTLTPSILGNTTYNWLGRSLVETGVDGLYLRSCLLSDFRIYDGELSQAEVKGAMGYPIATFPSPGDPNSATPIATEGSAMVVLPLTTTDVTLSWVKGAYADAVNGHHVYISTNYTEVDTNAPAADKGLTSNTNYPLAGPNAPVKGLIYYWRIDEVNGANNWKGLIWSFMVMGKSAYFPIPLNGATLVPPKMTLRWTTGAGATGHDVYFGTDNPPLTLRQSLTAPRSDPNWSPYRSGLTLAYNTTYYWQIKEWEGATLWPGPVWSFRTVPKGPPEPNLVGWWKFENDPCDSAYGCDGTAYNGPTYPAGFFDSGIYFNNANNTDPADDIYVSVPINYVISSLRASTFAMWVNWPNVNGRDERFFSFGTAQNNHLHFAPEASTSAPLHFQILTPGSSPEVGYGSNATNAGTMMPNDGWHHVAVTIAEPNATTGLSPFLLYLDANQVGSNTAANRTPSNLGVTTQNWLGRSENPVTQRPYNGYLDDLRIYDKALTASEIRLVMTGDPNLATKPIPANWLTIVIDKVKPLSWTKGKYAAKHDVYFGTDEASVQNANTNSPPSIYRGRRVPDTNTSYTPPEELQMTRTYYWRIDEVNEVSGKIWPGHVWRFIVADYLIADDFESYNNNSPNRIFDTWKAVGGAKVGYSLGDPNYAEMTIIRGGKQAMPFDYNNLKSPSIYDSNVYREFTTPQTQNWARLGVKALSLWLRGYMAPVGSFTRSASPPYTYTMTASGTDINVVDLRHSPTLRDEFRYAYIPISVDNFDIIVKVDSLTQTNPAGTPNAQAKAGVMIRDSLDDDSAYAMVCITTGGSGAWFQWRGPKTSIPPQDRSRRTHTGLVPPYWLRLERYFNEYAGYIYNAWYSPSGQDGTWYPLDDPDLADTDSIQVNMTDPVYIGLILSARDATATCRTVFSNVSITQGGQTGRAPDDPQAEPGPRGENVALPWPWPNGDIGIKSNTAAPLYVTLQDSTKSKTLTHDDPNIVLATSYTEWRIPTARFSDLDLTAIKKITIGVGNRIAPQHVGVGTLYVDDIDLYIPRCITGRPRAAADLTANVNDIDDSDCIVGYADLLTLTNRWLLAPQASNRAIDMDDSNMVDIKDYAILAGMWLDQILWPPPVTKIWAYEFKNDANCYTLPDVPKDANDLHLEFDGAVFLIDTGPFSTWNSANPAVDIGTFRGNGTNKITLASGNSTPTTSVPAYRRAIIRVGSTTGTEKTLTKWWWTDINGVRIGNEMLGVGPSCKKID